MANLTIAIDDHLLQAARLKALQQGTSVNEICREAIERFAQADEAVAQRLAKLRRLAVHVGQRTAPERLWPGREAFYDEVLRERGLLGPRDDSAP
ncbi:MAG: hypothetical protein ABI574_11720 [Burkholderiales bacterium]